MVSTVIQDLNSYWVRAKAAQAKSNAEKGADLIVGHHTHTEHSKKRLLFIRFIA